jgi:hypothetical protein
MIWLVTGDAATQKDGLEALGLGAPVMIPFRERKVEP